MDVFMVGKDDYMNDLPGWSDSYPSATWTGSASSVASGTIMGNNDDVTIVFTIEDETTGINTVNANAANNADVWYDLNGRRLPGKPATKGVFIQNGKKVVVK